MEIVIEDMVGRKIVGKEVITTPNGADVVVNMATEAVALEMV